MSLNINAAQRSRSAVTVRAAAAVVYAATVTRAPASTADSVGVVLDHTADSRTLRHDVDDWPHKGAALPAVDDRCIVAFDDAGTPHIQSWRSPSWGGP